MSDSEFRSTGGEFWTGLETGASSQGAQRYAETRVLPSEIGAGAGSSGAPDAPLPLRRVRRPRRRVMTARVWIGIAGLVAVAALVALITLSPTPVDAGHRALVKELLSYLHGHGVPAWFGYNKLEFSANILMFVPVGFFIGLVLPMRYAWIGGLCGMAFSIAVEIAQLVMLPERFASGWDVLANSTGAWIGIGVAVLLRLCVAARDRRLLCDAAECWGVPLQSR
ncbi:MAG: VanZ family protein [Leucobacter sp.]